MKKVLLLIVAITLVGTSVFSQEKNGFGIKYFKNQKFEGNAGYHFFLSDDKDAQELFQTTIMGFGSGFFDMFTGRWSVDAVNVGWDKFNLSLGLGYSVMKYRFAENLVISHGFDADGNEINGTTAFIDPDETHDYVNTFFGYGKSKLVYWTFSVPVHVNVKLGKMSLGVGPLADFYISGKLKRKYKEDGEKVKVKIKNSDFRKYDINTSKYGINAFLQHESGINLGFTYMMTPFFNSENIPDLHEVRVSLGYSFNKNMGGKKNNPVKSI